MFKAFSCFPFSSGLSLLYHKVLILVCLPVPALLFHLRKVSLRQTGLSPRKNDLPHSRAPPPPQHALFQGFRLLWLLPLSVSTTKQENVETPWLVLLCMWNSLLLRSDFWGCLSTFLTEPPGQLLAASPFQLGAGLRQELSHPVLSLPNKAVSGGNSCRSLPSPGPRAHSSLPQPSWA